MQRNQSRPWQRWLIRLLLLAVFFNTAVGSSAHEAMHLERATSVLAVSQAAQETPDTDASRSFDEASAACAWCTAHANLGLPPTSALAVPAWVEQTCLLRPQRHETFVRRPARWHFAARDPPIA
jgi:Protein of unknown function (DUF2946)